MAIYKATIEIVLEADGDGEACDAIAETMRENLREFAPASSLIDWRYTADSILPEQIDALPDWTEYTL